MSNDKEPSLKEIEFNQSLWHWYPLGQVDAIWNMVDHLRVQLNQFPEEVDAVFDALQRLDDKIRVNWYPMPKQTKGVKQSNGKLLAKQKKRRKSTKVSKATRNNS